MDAIVRLFRGGGGDKECRDSPNSAHLREMLKSKHPRRDCMVEVGDPDRGHDYYPLKSPDTVVSGAGSSTEGVPKHRVSCFVRAIVRTYLALVENKCLDMGVHVRDLRTVDEPVFDPYNALALACSMCSFLLNSCGTKYKENYFETNGGKLCLCSVITLSLKFCKGSCFYFMPAHIGSGFHSAAAMVFFFMFGNCQQNHGAKKSLSHMLYETECYLLSKMGGRFFQLYRCCISARAEDLIEDALQAASNSAEREVVLKCRNLLAVYCISIQCLEHFEALLSMALREESYAQFVVDVVLLVATQSLQSGLPGSLAKFDKVYQRSNDVATITASRLLLCCCENVEHVPLIKEARRSVVCGDLFSEATQRHAAEVLISRLKGKAPKAPS